MKMTIRNLLVHSATLLLVLAVFSCKSDLSDLQKENAAREAENRPCLNIDQSETYGTAFHDVLTYDLAYFDAEEYLPSSFNQNVDFEEEFLTVSQLTDGWPLEQLLDTYLPIGGYSVKMTELHPALAQNILEVDSLVKAGFQGKPDFQAIADAIQGLTDSKMLDESLTCSDKKSITGANGIAKNFIFFLDEHYGEAANAALADGYLTARGCSFWQNLGCVWDNVVTGMIIGAGVGGVVAAATGNAVIVPFPDGNGFSITAITPAGKIMMLVGAVAGGVTGYWIGVANLDENECCPEELDCKAVTAFSVKINSANCQPIAEYTPWGYGADATALNWANSGGTPATATTFPSNARLTITQTSSSTPVSTVVTTVCSDGTMLPMTSPYMQNLSTMVNSVFGVSLFGPDSVVPGETYEYFSNGISANQYNFTTEWSVSPSGTIVFSNSNFAVLVQWDENMTDGWVKLKVTNDCSGQTVTFQIDVEGDGTDIP